MASSSSSSSQVLAGGNPTNYRDNTHSITSNSNVYSQIHIANVYLAQNFSGPFTQISFSWDLLLLGSNAVGYRPLIVQGGQNFTTSALTVASNGLWQSNSMAGLTQSSFCLLQAAQLSLDCTQHPDFNSGVSVGFLLANSFAGSVGSVGNYASGIDNFSVTVNNAVPEPSSVALLGSSLAWLVYRRNR